MKKFLWALSILWYSIFFLIITGGLLYLALFQRQWIGPVIILAVIILHITFFTGLLINRKSIYCLSDILKRYCDFFIANYLDLIEIPIYVLYIGLVIFKWIGLVLGIILGLPVFIGMILEFGFGLYLTMESDLNTPLSFILFTAWIIVSALLIYWHARGYKKWKVKYPDLPGFGDRLGIISDKFQHKLPTVNS